MKSEFTSRERVIAALERRPHDRVPYIEHLFDPRVTHRDNVTYWGALNPFLDNSYVLNPEEAEKGFNADGLLKTKDDFKYMHFRPIDDEFWESAYRFLESKGDYAANAMLWLGIDPTWHSMGFEHFAISLVVEPDLVAGFPSRISDWCASVAEGLCKESSTTYFDSVGVSQ